MATAATAVLLWLAALAVASLAASASFGLVHLRMARRAPRTRAATAALFATAPVALATLLVALCFAPGVVGWATASGDHCAKHPEHPHLCLVHPLASREPAVAIALASLLAVAGCAATRAARAVARARRDVEHLRTGRIEALERGVELIDSRRVFSFATGGPRARILISTALAQAVEPGVLAAVIAHERAHLARLDPWIGAVARIASRAIPRAVREQILGELDLASELACDEAAARDVGDRLLVARALVAVARLASADRGARALFARSFASASIELRVASLLEAPSGVAPARTRATRWLRRAATALALAALVAIASQPVHHLVEHAIEQLVAPRAH